MISFVGSMVFMIHLVCGLKATICMSSKLNVNIEGILFHKVKNLHYYVEDHWLVSVYCGNQKIEDNK
jgi:hypothetical protein